MKSLGLLGRKVGMTTIFDDKGNSIPVTVLALGPCYVVQKKTVATDGYNAIQIGFEKAKARYERRRVNGKVVKKVVFPNKPLSGHFKKANLEAMQNLIEFRVEDIDKYQVGQELKVDQIFGENLRVDVMGISKGRGFAGGVKRWHWKGGSETHGSMFHRAVGSIGASSSPSRVYKNQSMPGRMGGKKVTVQNIKVVKIDADKNMVLVNGAVPGARGGLVVCKQAVLAQK